ncbi:hypothetical protein [Nonomuraea insulae]|uniref:NIPSNAP domain-containing protein n=1 Tax=Nonomuraea insulae TaxID=1616787 RepID=A0ABW1CE87_9ACTN
MDTRYITPDAISEVRRGIRDELLPIFTEVRQILEENKSIDFPGWGPIGEWTVGALYRSMIDSFVDDAEAAHAVLTKWESEDLSFAERNWRTAEDLIVRRVGRKP